MPNNGLQGTSGHGGFRSSVFQIHFYSLPKLVAVYPLAPEPGRYAEYYTPEI